MTGLLFTFQRLQSMLPHFIVDYLYTVKTRGTTYGEGGLLTAP